MSFAVYDAFLGSLSLRQCSTANYSPGGNAMVARMSGAVDPSLIAGGQATPKATFATGDLYSLLTSLGVTDGLSIASGTIVLPLQERLQGSTFAGSAAHKTLTAANALVVPMSIDASQQGDFASGNVEVNFRSTDGLTDPVTINSSQSLSAQAFVASYKMGPVKARIGADGAVAQIPGITSQSWNPGLQVGVRSFDGGIWPTLLTINQRDPSLDLTFEDSTALSRFNATYTSITSITGYLRKCSDGGTFVADGTSQHISLTLTGGLAMIQSIGAQQNADGTITARFLGKSLAVSLTAAITL